MGIRSGVKKIGSAIGKATSFVFSPFRPGIGSIKESFKDIKDTNVRFNLIRQANKELYKTSQTQIINGFGKYFVEMKTKSGNVLLVNQKGKILKAESEKIGKKIKYISQLDEPIKVNDNVNVKVLCQFVDIAEEYLTPEQINQIYECSEEENSK